MTLLNRFVLVVMFAMTLCQCRGFISSKRFGTKPPTIVVRLASTSTAASTTKTTSGNNKNTFPLVAVKRTRQSRSFRDGNPLVFPGAIAYTCSQQEQIDMGTLVGVGALLEKEKRSGKKKSEPTYPHRVESRSDGNTPTQFIGWGVYNPHSMYRVRILCHASTHPTLARQIKQCKEESEAIQHIVSTTLQSALQSRLALSLPNPDTDTYRLVNGEGDGLSGLAVDVLGGKVAVVMSSASWCEIHKDTIKDTLQHVLAQHPSYSDNDMDIVWKTTTARLKQDGYNATAVETTMEDKQANLDTAVITTESGIRYNSLPYQQGQKTGVYCDQRENRRYVASFCRDKSVLDLCSYHGGFALNALIHGNASSVVGVDSSQDAIDAARANILLNDCDADKIEFVQDDISHFMKQARSNQEEWDVVVLDPPKLAPSASGLDRASRKYHALNRDALHLVSPTRGGLLLSCSCSAAMTQKDGGQYFLNMVQRAAVSAGRSITLLKVNGAAPCHTQSPASYPAGAYMTAALFHVSPVITA